MPSSRRRRLQRNIRTLREMLRDRVEIKVFPGPTVYTDDALPLRISPTLATSTRG
jgi:hypothetical protein